MHVNRRENETMGQWQARMRKDWDERARQDAMHYIMTDRSDWSLAEFLQSGENDIVRFVDPFLESRRVGRESALDVGCGIGRLAVPLARRFTQVDALDISQEMIDKAKELHASVTNLNFSVGSGVDLERFASDRYDLVFSYIMLQHIPDPEIIYGYLREFGRVLKPGGWTFFQVPNDAISGHEKYLRRWEERRDTLIREGRAVPFEDHDHAYLESKIRSFETIVQQPVEYERVMDALDVHNVAIRETTGRGTSLMWVAAQKAGGTNSPIKAILSAARQFIGRQHP
jgi:2-polyprenyl-3-methyl-5-hydroxy-6-metoxy-1,4-benzoquinol methylase